jgi:hypothetical protein
MAGSLLEHAVGVGRPAHAARVRILRTLIQLIIYSP